MSGEAEEARMSGETEAARKSGETEAARKSGETEAARKSGETQEARMSDSIEEMRGLRERLATGAEDRLGRAFSDLLDNPLLSGALGRAFDAREKAAQAQELAMGALNLPSASDIERLTRRLRSVSQRLEAIEDSISRLERTTTGRLAAIEEQLRELSTTKKQAPAAPSARSRRAKASQSAPA